MKYPNCLIWIVMLAGLLVAGTLDASGSEGHDHHHGHADEAGVALLLNDGERWATDEPLQVGMNGILAAFSSAHAAYRAHELDRSAAAGLADDVDEQISFIFANCNLPAAADAELHKLLAQTMQASSTLRESDDVHEGLHALHGVLRTYGEFFDHPGWSADMRH